MANHKGKMKANTLCWLCENSVPCPNPFRGCAWSVFGVPVQGWDAKPTIIHATRGSDSDVIDIPSYLVYNCPEFKAEVQPKEEVRCGRKKRMARCD